MNPSETPVKGNPTREKKEAVSDCIGFIEERFQAGVSSVAEDKNPKRFLIKRQERSGTI